MVKFKKDVIADGLFCLKIDTSHVVAGQMSVPPCVFERV